MLTSRIAIRGRHLVAAAAFVLAGLTGAGSSAQAAPFAPAPAVAASVDSGIVQIRHGRGHGRGHHYGWRRHHHHHWRPYHHRRHHYRHHHRRHWRY